jgi:prevent-host-death family protein
MSKAPQIVPMSDLRLRQSQVMRMMNKAPVYLAQRGRPIGVLVSVEQWNALQEELEDLDDMAAVYKHKWMSATGQVESVVMTPEELEAWAQKDEKVSDQIR